MDIVKRLRELYRFAAEQKSRDWDEQDEIRHLFKLVFNIGYDAADEIERLREALRLIAAPSKIIAKSEDMAVMLQLLLTSHRQTALKALGEDHD